MLASVPVRAAGERSLPVRAGAPFAAAAAVSFCALFFSGGAADAPLVWIGGAAVVAAALTAAAMLAGVLPAAAPGGPAAAYAGCLLGLAVWAGTSTVWSISPDRSWAFANRTLVYAAFALLGVLLAVSLPRGPAALAAAAALLLGLVLGWALLAKCLPALYPDYGRVARLRSPVAYWNELALLCDVATPLALWLAAARGRPPGRRAAGALLLFAATVTLLLTYSRFGVALALVAAAAWVAIDGERVESLATLALGGGAGAAVFGIALALRGITHDGQPRSVRGHDGWIFALVLLAAGAAVFAAAVALARFERRRPLEAARRRRIERVAAAVALAFALAGLATSIVFAGRIWSEFTNPVASQISESPGRFRELSSSNRWRWWSEEWRAFVAHPGGGTGAGTFELTDERLRRSPLVTTEPHNTPLQFLGETGIVGLLLYLGAIAAAALGGVRAWRRTTGPERAAVAALAVGSATFFAHTAVDTDWSYVATCGPLLLLTGALAASGPVRPLAAAAPRRLLLAAGAAVGAVAAVYSLAAPWLAQRELAAGHWQRAHSYDPLSTAALTDWAAAEEGAGRLARAASLYRRAVSLEPQSSDTWYALGAFYFDHAASRQAYDALSKAWTYDRFGPAGEACGLLDRARHRVLGVWPASCPGGRRPRSP
ncbi:MAG: hypothetical protein V7644_249 [Actinomycetota bacterium]